MREADGHGGEAQVRGDVPERVHGGRLDEVSKLLLVNRAAERRILEAERVQHGAVDGADNHVHGGNGPRERELVEERLVVDVEANVQRVPEEDEPERGESLLSEHATILLFLLFGGAASSR